MAEFVMKEHVRKAGLKGAVYVESAAMHRDEIGSDVHYGTKEILDRYGIPYEQRAARLATSADYGKFDYLVGMDRYNMRDMMRLYHNDPEGKLSLLMEWVGTSRDVADPWYTGDFDTTYEDVDAGCVALIEHLRRIRIVDHGQRVPKALGAHPASTGHRTCRRREAPRFKRAHPVRHKERRRIEDG